MCGPSLTETSLCDAWLYHALTSSMEQSPSWEANRFSTNQEIPRILGNPNVHYRIQKCPPPVPIRTLLLLFILNMLHYFPVQSQRNLFFSGTDLNGISLIFRYRSQRNFCSFPVQISAEFLLFSGTYLSGISLIFRYTSQRNFSYFPVQIPADFFLFSGTDLGGISFIFWRQVGAPCTDRQTREWSAGLCADLSFRLSPRSDSGSAKCGWNLIHTPKWSMAFTASIFTKWFLAGRNYVEIHYTTFHSNMSRDFESTDKYSLTILFLSFRRVLNVNYSFLGNYPASEF